MNESAVIGFCLVVTVLALAGVSVVMVMLIWRRLCQRDAEAADEMARLVIDSFKRGSASQQETAEQLANAAESELEKRRDLHRYRPDDIPPPAGDEPVIHGEFGNAPVSP